MTEEQKENDTNVIASQLIIKRAVEVICGKWRLTIINLLRQDKLRYNEIKRLIPDISEKVLVHELRQLISIGLLSKQAFNEMPPRVEYTLTDKGRKVLPVIDLLQEVGPEIM